MTDDAFAFDTRLDTEYLQSLYEGDTTYAAEIFQQFLNNYPEQWKELETNLTRGDIQSYKGNIHKMKASFSFVGLTQLTQKAQLVEQYCTGDHDANTLAAMQHEFKTLFLELIPIVENELKRLKA
jgi:HPt (histidine-containing phosphotransfer) domain-containing protein